MYNKIMNVCETRDRIAAALARLDFPAFEGMSLEAIADMLEAAAARV